MMKNPQTVTFTLNGERKTFITRPDEKLLDLLRREGYKGTKFGCGQGTCGACTVLMDGRAIYSCLLYSMQAENRDIRTIESIGTHDKPSEFQQELIAAGAVQCGYCIPGMIMSAEALMKAEKTYPEEVVREYMDGNLCRCTGYEKIWDALQTVLARREAANKAKAKSCNPYLEP